MTGAATGVGALLTERLAASEEIKQVVAIDERRGECADAQWHILDVRDPAIADKLRGADVVVHLALDLDLETDPAARTAYNVRGTQTVLTAAAAAGVHRVVLCTSAMVYGALPDNELPPVGGRRTARDRRGDRGRGPAGDRTAGAAGAARASGAERHRGPPGRPGRRHRHRADQVLRVAAAAGRRRVAARVAVLPCRGPVQRPGVRRPGEGRRGAGRRLRRMAGAGGGRGAGAGSGGWSCRRRSRSARRPGCTGSASPRPRRATSRTRCTPGCQREPAARRRVAAEMDQRGGPRGAAGGGLRAAHGGRAATGTQGRDGRGAAGATVALLGAAAVVRRARKARRRV